MTARENVPVAVFRAANNWPLYAAVRNRLIDQVEVIHISSSKDQLAGLVNNEYGIVHTAADNILAAYGNPGYGSPEASKPKIFMGGDNGFLSVYSSPAIRSLGELREKKVGFDSTNSGFAFVLKKILSIVGLKEGGYSEVVVGGTDLRYKALIDRSIDAAIMTPPYDLLCSASGFTKLADASRYFPSYQGLVGACCPGFPGASFLRAYKTSLVNALNWLKERSNKDAAVHILRDYLQAGTGTELISDLYDSMFSRKGVGFADDGRVDLDGLSKVAMLRREFSPSAALRPLSDYLMKL